MKRCSSLSTTAQVLIFIFLVASQSCEMPATSFDKVENTIYYSKNPLIAVPQPDSTIRVMTWNIRFGIGRGPWFGDACGYKVIYSPQDILQNLAVLAYHINTSQPDVLFLQEVDINSKRSGYIDELQWILDHTYFNYAVYGSQWKAQFIPSDGLGRMNEGNAILSRWPIANGQRIQLSLRGDQDELEKYFYERCNIIKAQIEIPGFQKFYALTIHASAFATDDSKHQHIEEFKNELDKIAARDEKFVAGGDLNTLPPGSDTTDYCMQDKCDNESFHQSGNNPMHKEGSNYTPESQWMVPLYSEYKSVIPLNVYLASPRNYFTHTTRPAYFWDRTLDYLFTNYRWRTGSGQVHQDFINDSDHAPVSGDFIVK